MAPSGKSTDTRRTSQSLKSSGTGSKKKKITIRMESLALRTLTCPAADDDPIAVRDYPDGCNPLPNTSTSRKDSANTSRQCRLITNPGSDSEESDHASISRRETQPPDFAPADHSPTEPEQPVEEDAELLIMAPNATINDTTQTPPDAQLPTPETSRGDPTQFFPFLWYSFSVHEALNVAAGSTPSLPFTAEYLASKGTPETEIHEYFNCRHAFPHVPQQLFPTTRPDSVKGQYYHLTQIPQDSEIDLTTGLSPTYPVTIRFDAHYHNMSKLEVQQAALSRLETMRIPLASRFREPIAVLISQQNAGWLGFLKIDLLNPGIDGIALLQGHRLFTLQMQNGEYTI